MDKKSLRKKYLSGGLDANNLSPQTTPSNSSLDYLNQNTSGLSPEESTKLLDSSPSGSAASGTLAASARGAGLEQRSAEETGYGQQDMYQRGYMTPEFSPEMYKTVYQSNMKNSWNTLFNNMREQRKSGLEYDLGQIRMKLAEFENAKTRADDFYAQGLISSQDHSKILQSIEKNAIGDPQQEDLVGQLIDGVMDGLHTNLTADDYTAAVQRAEDAGLLNKTKLEKSLSGHSDTYASLLDDKEDIKTKIADREQEIEEGGFGSLFGIPLPMYGGGKVGEDYKIRSAIEKNMGATVLSSIPIVSKAAGLTDKWMGDEYFEYKASEDIAGTISTFEGQVAAILGPALVQVAETQVTDKLLKGVKNPWVRGASALLQFGAIVAGNVWSRNLETKMEAGDAYWQKVDMLEQQYSEQLKKDGHDRDLTQEEKNNIAIVAGEGLDELFEKNMALGGSDIMQFALTFMKIPGLSKAFTGSTFRNIVAREAGSRFWSRGLVKAGTFATGVAISRELEGMEEGLQYRWSQDYLGGYNQERSGSWLNNVWNSTKDAAVDAVDYGMNMSGLRNSNPDIYESLSFKHAVQSGRDMATMMTGGGRAASNWGGARGFVELQNAINLLGENGDALNAENLIEQKKDMLYKYFDEGKEGDLYDAIYRMGRSKNGMDGFTKADAVEVINEIKQAKTIYDDVFNDKSPLAISAFGINYDIGRSSGPRGYTKSDKKQVFKNALEIVKKQKINKDLDEKQEAYREGKDQSLDLYTTALTPEERVEYDDPNTAEDRKKELSEKLKDAEPSHEQKENLRTEMNKRNLDTTPYDLEIIENKEAIEHAKKENEGIATEEKTFITDPITGFGALWNKNEYRRYKDLNKSISDIVKKEEITEDDKVTLHDLILEKNKILYEQAFEYVALQKGRLNNKMKRAAAMHGIGSIMQHIEKYGAKGLDKILPSILENNAKLDPQTIEDITRLSDEIVKRKTDLEAQLAEIEDSQNKLKKSFNNETLVHDIHEPLTSDQQDELKRLRRVEEETGELSRDEQTIVDNLSSKGLIDKQLKDLTKESEDIKAEIASIAATAAMAETFTKRIEENPASFELKDELFEKLSDDKILEEAALAAMDGMEYIADQLEHLPEYADVATADRVYQNIKGRLEIFRRKLVEAPEHKKDYMQNIVDKLEAASGTMKGMITIIKENAADRTAEQYAFEERTFSNLLQSLGLKPDFTLDDKSIFKSIGTEILSLLGDNVNILKNALKVLEEGEISADGVIMGMTDKVAVALVAVELIKSELKNQPKILTEIKEALVEIHRAQADAVKDIVAQEISSPEQAISTEEYMSNPANGIRGLLHQISTLDADKDLNDRNSALWKYVDHLDTGKLIEDIVEEDRADRKVSSESLISLLGHHTISQNAVKLHTLLTSNFDAQSQLINEEVLIRTKAEQYIPTKQQINAIREISLFINTKSDVALDDNFNLGDVSAFLQGAAGTGKSKIILPWALHTAGVVNNKVFAIGHNGSSSKTINEALGLEGNTFESFTELSDADASDLKLLVIDEAPSLSDIQYQAIQDKVLKINIQRKEQGESFLKVIMLGDEAQITTESMTPLLSFNTFGRMNTTITPVTSIYRSDNPAIATFQDIFRRRREDISNEEIIVKLNKPNPWMPEAMGVYGVSGDFKERLILKLQTPVASDVRRAIITNPERVEEYQAFLKTNQISNVDVMSFIDAQGETVDEVYMDIEKGKMQDPEYNDALYTASSRAQSLIVAANLNLRNTVDAEMNVVQDTLSKEFEDRRVEFEEEVKENSELLTKFEGLEDPEDLLNDEESLEEDEEGDDDGGDGPTVNTDDGLHSSAKDVERDEHSEDATPTEEEEILEEQVDEQDKTNSWVTEGEDLTDAEDFVEDAVDSDDASTAYKEGDNDIEMDTEIDVKDKHVLYYPEYDGLSATIFDNNTTILPIQDNTPVFFVKTQTVGRDGNFIEGIVVLQDARQVVEKGHSSFMYGGKQVYRRVAVIGSDAEIDSMNFLSKTEKADLKYQLANQAPVQFTELAEAGDKSLLVDDTGYARRSNLIKGLIIPRGGARRLTYKYKSRKSLHETGPTAANFQKQNKGLIKRLLKIFVEQFYDQKQKISPEQQINIKESRVRVFKKKDIQDLRKKGEIPTGFNLKSGMPYLVIKGVEAAGSKSKTQYIALTPRRLSMNIKDDVKQYFEPISEFVGTAMKIEDLTGGNLQLGTKQFVDFIRGTDNAVKKIALNLGNPKLIEPLINLRDNIRSLKWDVVETNGSGSLSRETRGTGRAQLAMDRLAKANSVFREEKRTMIKGKKVRRIVSKSLLSYPGTAKTARGPITTKILNTVFNNQDDKGFNQMLYLPVKMSDLRDIDYSGTSSKYRSAADNHKAAEKTLTSQLTEIESTKIILDRSETVKEKEEDVIKSHPEKTMPIKVKKPKKKKKRGGSTGGTDSLTGKEYRKGKGRKKEEKGEYITKDDAKKLLKRLLPDLFNEHNDLIPGNVVFLDALRMIELTENKHVLGKFINQRIYLLEERDGILDNVIRHEVFHKITAYYLTKKEREILFSTARVKYNLPKSFSDSEVEERLAREFMKFRRNENSVPAMIRRIFKKIAKFLGFVDKNAGNIEKLFDNIDSGYFAGKRVVGDPIDTNMNYQDLLKEWGSIEVYREARARFVAGMSSLLKEYDSAIIDDKIVMSEVDIQTGTISATPLSRDEALDYLVEEVIPDDMAAFEKIGLDKLDVHQMHAYKALKELSKKRKAKYMFADVYQRDQFTQGYEMEEDVHLDSVNLADVIEDANSKDHNKNLTESVVEVLTGITYQTADGKIKRLSIKHAYYKMLQLLSDTDSTNHLDLRRAVSNKSASLGHKKGSAGWAVKEAIIHLIDSAFNNQVTIGEGRDTLRRLEKELKDITGKTKASKEKRKRIRVKIDKALDKTSRIPIPKHMYFPNDSLFLYSEDLKVDAQDILYDLKQKDAHSAIAKKKGESSEEFYYRIYAELASKGIGVPAELLIALNRKNKADQDLKNIFVNTSSLREETFMMGDYEYKYNQETNTSNKHLRFYKHKEFGTRSVISDDIRNFTEEHITIVQDNASKLLTKIKNATTSEDKMKVAYDFMKLIKYPSDRVNISPRDIDNVIMKLEGFLKEVPKVGKRNQGAKKITNDKGREVYPLFTISDLLDDERSFIESLGDMLKIEHEATKAHSIRSVEGKTIYAFHNSSFGVDVLNNIISNRKGSTPAHLQKDTKSYKQIYKFNIFANGKSELREIHDWDGIIDKKRKYTPTTYSQESEKGWLDRNFNYWFVNGLKEAGGNLFYTQQLTTVSDKSSPKAAQVQLLNDQQIVESVKAIVEQYHNKPIKKSLVFSNILQNSNLSKSQKVSKILQVFNDRTDALVEKAKSEETFKNIESDLASARVNLRSKKYLKKPKGNKEEKNLTETNKDLISVFVSNYAINSFFLNQLVLGDTAAFKNSYDVVKRMSIAFAPGYKGFVNPIIGMKDKFRIAVMDDPQGTAFDFLSAKDRKALLKDIKDLGLDNKFDLADGQGFILPSRLQDLRRGFGGGLKAGVVMKPVYYGIDENGDQIALKYSTVTLKDDLVDKHKGLKALRDAMESAEVDELVMKSAVKIGSPNNEDLSEHGYSPWKPGQKGFKMSPKINPNSIRTLSNKNLRIQLDPVHDANTLVSNPSQLAFMINTNGLNAIEAQQYYETMATIIDLGAKEFFQELGLMSNGQMRDFTNLSTSRRRFVETKIRNKILKGAKIQESAHKEAEILSAKDVNGQPAVSINFPGVVNKVFSVLASSLSAATIKIKFPGSKLVLQTGYGASVYETQLGEVLLQDDIINLAAEKGLTLGVYMQTNGIIERPLKHITADRPYAEVLMPRVHAKKFNIGDEIYDQDMLGFRIPSTELHSSVALKVVGFYDSLDTNVIIAPKELQTIHGSDFDVDSLFVIRKAHSTDTSKSGKRLYTNSDKGLTSRNGTVYIEPSQTVPSTEKFLINVANDINHYKNKVKENGVSIAQALNDADKEVFKETKKRNKEMIGLLERVQQAALKNKMLDIYLKVLRKPENRNSILSPISMSNFKGEVIDGVDINNSVFGAISKDMGLTLEEGHDQLYESRDLSNPLDELYMHQSNQQGSILTGAGANAMKALVYMMNAAKNGEPSYLIDKKLTSEDGTVAIAPFSFEIDGVSYSELSRYEKHPGNKFSSNTIWATMDSIVNASIDNAKEQILNIINMNQATASMFYVMIGTGVPLHTAVRILLQPAVQEAARRNSKDFNKGATEVRDLIKLKIAESNYTAEQLDKLDFKINTKKLSKGIRRTSPNLKNNLDKRLGSTVPDLVFQLKVLDLLSPEGNKRGLSKFGSDLTKVSKVLNVLRKLPSNHEELTDLTRDMAEMFSEDSSLSFEISNIENALPHVKAARETSDALYGMSGQILDVNNPVLVEYSETISKMLGSTSTSEDSTTATEKYKNIREEFIRYLASSLVNTAIMDPIIIQRGDIKTTVGGTQALSHNLAEIISNHPHKTTNAFLNRVSVKTDRRGLKYLVGNSKGILQPELVQVYADFSRLDPQLQDLLLLYTVAKEGMLFASSNLTMIMRPELFGATADRKVGYDIERSKLLFDLVKTEVNTKTGISQRLENSKESFMVQYALSNINQIASIGTKKISEAIVKDNGSIFGTRRKDLTTGETVFYDLKVDQKLLPSPPQFLSNPKYSQVYVLVHSDIAEDGLGGYSYYQTVAKGSSTASLYSVEKQYLSEQYAIKDHFKKNTLVRPVNDVTVDSIELFSEVKGLKEGDKIVLRTHNDTLRVNAVQRIITSIKKVETEDSTKWKVSFSKGAPLSSFKNIAAKRYAAHVASENKCK